MSVTAIGIFSEPPESLRTSLSALTGVWSFLGVSDSTAALALIHTAEVPKTATAYDPAFGTTFIFISPPDDLRIARGAFTAGSMWILFRRAVPSQYQASYRDAHYDFSNAVSAAVVQIPNALEASGTLISYPVGLRLATPWQRSDLAKEATDYMQVSFTINYGVEMEA